MIKFKVPATIGNVGPGFDVLGLAVDGLFDEYIVEESEIDQIIVHGIDSEKIPKDPKNNTVFIAAYKVSELINKSHRSFKVTINRSLPSSGGMGSSAASSVAGAIIPFLLNGMDPEEKIVIEASLEAEANVSGRHLIIFSSLSWWFISSTRCTGFEVHEISSKKRYPHCSFHTLYVDAY